MMQSNAAMQKISDLGRRAKRVKLHAIIINKVLERGPKGWSYSKGPFK
jgi:hypothetical protein